MAVALAFSAMIIFLSLLFQIYICLNFRLSRDTTIRHFSLKCSGKPDDVHQTSVGP